MKNWGKVGLVVSTKYNLVRTKIQELSLRYK